MKLVSFLARQKYFLDQGASFTALVNLALLSITASASLGPLVHIQARWVAPGIFVMVVVVTWAMGYWADRLGFPKAYQDEMNERNEMLKEAAKK